MVTRKSTRVAGSAQGPAAPAPDTTSGAQAAPEGGAAPEGEKAPDGAPQPLAASQPEGAAQPGTAAQPEVVAQPEVLAQPEVVRVPFPRDIEIVNDSPFPRVVAGAYIKSHSRETVTVRDDDQITRIQTEIQHLLELSPEHADLDEKPLRVVDAAADE